MRFLLTYGLLILWLCPFYTYGQLVNKKVKAEIKIIYNDNYFDVIAIAQNKTDVYTNISYLFKIISKDQNANSATNEQEGRATINALEIKELSKVNMNATTDKQLIVLLLLYDEDSKMIGRDRVVIKDGKKVIEKEQVLVLNKPSNDGIEITGIVVENTKTKAGKDFYDFFYNKYLFSTKKLNKVIEISELLFNGRRSRIDIKIEEKLLTSFFVQPNEEFLELMADQVLYKVQRHIVESERKKEFIKY